MDAVVFDFDETLVDYRHGDSAAIDGVVGMLARPIDAGALLRKSQEAIRALYDSGLSLGSDIHRLRLKISLEHFGVAWDEAYLREYLRIYCREARPFPHVVAALEAISGKVKLGLLTNSMDSTEQRARIAASGLGRFFDRICLASELGCFKPEKEAFLAVLGQLNARPGTAAFVGDSEEHDIVGARRVGMKAIKRRTDASASTADYTFSDYRELEGILGRLGAFGSALAGPERRRSGPAEYLG